MPLMAEAEVVTVPRPPVSSSMAETVTGSVCKVTVGPSSRTVTTISPVAMLVVICPLTSTDVTTVALILTSTASSELAMSG